MKLDGVTTSGDEDDEESSDYSLHSSVQEEEAIQQSDEIGYRLQEPAAPFFDLNVDGIGPNLTLTFSIDAIRRIRLFVACASGLADLSPSDIASRFQAVATPAVDTNSNSNGVKYVITRGAYDMCVKYLCFGAERSDTRADDSGESIFVDHIAGILFHHFEVDNGVGGPAVPFPEIAIAFSIFSPTKKSGKLGLAFELLGLQDDQASDRKGGQPLEGNNDDDDDDDDDYQFGHFGVWEFTRFFNTILRLLFALAAEEDIDRNDEETTLALHKRIQSIHDSSVYLGVLVVERIVGDTSDSETADISFYDFADVRLM